MKKILKILSFFTIFIILLILLTLIFIKLIHKYELKQDQEILQTNKIQSNVLQFNTDPIKYEEKNEKIKGIVSDTKLDGAVITITNVYHINYSYESTGKYLEKNVLDGYDTLLIHLTENSHILNYMNSSEMTFNDIKNGDILFYEGNTEYMSKSDRRIDNTNIYVLKTDDLIAIAKEQYKGVTEFKNVNIVYEDDSLTSTNVKCLYGKLNVTTMKNDELTYIFSMKTSNNTIIENGTTNKYADITLKEPFESNEFLEIKKITYK